MRRHRGSIRDSVPDRVSLTDPEVRGPLSGAPTSPTLIGLGAARQPVSVPLAGESPGHLLVCGAAGSGVTTIIRSVTAQLLGGGAKVTVLEPCRFDHRWLHAPELDDKAAGHGGLAEGIRGAAWVHDPAGMHTALEGLHAEARQRLRGGTPGEHTARPAPLVLVIDDIAAAVYHLDSYWRQARHNGDPARSPALDAIKELLFAGRAAGVTVVCGAHVTVGRTVFGRVSTQFRHRIITRCGPEMWDPLAPEIDNPPANSNLPPGRGHLVNPAGLTALQALTMTSAEAIGVALGRTPAEKEASAL